MADDREGENGKINVVVKTSKNKETIETEATATILKFKELVSIKFNAPVHQLCLIFAGRILKDGDTLASYSIKDGFTVHLVIKSDNRAQQQAAQHASGQQQSPSSTPVTSPASNPTSQSVPSFQSGLDGIGGFDMLGNSGNIHQMSQQLMSNPEMLRQMMDNPMVQSMMSNPDLIRQMILSNPQMQQIIERNPEISHILNNPDLMRQTMEMVRNPSVMQEMMRTHDRALSNLESLPGGFNALQRMYTDIQEPMLNATQEQRAQNNPFAALFGGTSASGVTSNQSSNPQQGTENTSPLPNPWSATPQPSQPLVPQTSTPSSASMATTTPVSSVGNNSSPNPSQQENTMTSMFQTPAMQSLMQQMTSNPALFQNMMQSPYMHDMMERMLQNPELMASMIRSNPMFQGNSQLADQVASRLPEFMQQMQNPDFQQAMTNPRVMQALMQIQQGMMQLQAEAPGLVPGVGLTGGSSPAMSTSSTTSPGNNMTTPTSQTSGTQGETQRPNAGGTPGTTEGVPQGNPMAQFMSQMMRQAMTQTQNPEVAYRAQLEQLAQMGFVDRARNIQALVATGGDLNAAIERLLQ
ncbi:ubiquilin-1-like isoform X2 [Pocillopora damicornis]|uniref:ubiquilin-1-like isoform X2 n=1 Tax=Pocillopora damicornis TaxID=46731 RepID=UPI000F558583|nr:ubiquilin-1-like isoform X2 [Pocillopora damicornis]